MEPVRIIFFLLAVLFVPARSFGNPPERSTDFTLFEENGKVGLKNNEGDILIPAAYDAIGWSNGKLSVIDKVVGYRSNGLWGLIHTSNKTITPPDFLDLKPGEGSNLIGQKRSSLSHRGLFGIINTSGKTIVPFIYDGLQLSNMRAVVMSRSGAKFQFGLVDLSHRILIPVEFRNVYSLGSLRYAVENSEGKTAIFSDEGAQITPFNIDSISSFRKDYAIVYQNRQQGLINRNGQMIVNPEYGEIKIDEKGTVSGRQTDQWFLLDGINQLISQCSADNIRPLTADRYAVMTAGKVQLVDNQLKPLHDDYFSFLGDFQNGLAVCRKSARAGAIDANGKIVIPAQYHDLAIEQTGFRACMDIGIKDRWILLDQQGKRITEKHYEYIAPFNGQYYPVKNRGFWGAMNLKGEEIIACVHDSLLATSGRNILVKFKGEYGIMDLNENWRVTPRANRLKVLNDTAYFEYAGTTTFLKSVPNNIVYFSENPLEFHEGTVREQLPSGGYWLIGLNGIIADRSSQPAESAIMFDETEGLRAIRKDGKFGFIDNVGRLRIANRYESARPFRGGLAAIQIRGKWGFIDRHENLVVQPIFDEVQDFDNGYTIVRQENLFGLLDTSGKTVLPVRYDSLIRNQHGRFILRQGKGYGLADASGALVIQPRYDSLVDPGNDFVIVERAGKYGLLTLRGVSTVPMIYDVLSFDTHHQHFVAMKKSAWQTINIH
jgi:hypothetical protein